MHITNHVFHPQTGQKLSIEKLPTGPHKVIWSRSLANEFGRLTQGVDRNRPCAQYIQGMSTIRFIHPSEMPPGAKVTYGNFIRDIHQHKKEKHRVRLTVGGDRIDYEHDASSPAVSLLDTKLMINSVISDAHRGAIYCTADIQNFYLNNLMKTYCYMRIPLHPFPDEIINEYSLRSITVNGFMYIEIQQGVYGLK